MSAPRAAMSRVMKKRLTSTSPIFQIVTTGWVMSWGLRNITPASTTCRQQTAARVEPSQHRAEAFQSPPLHTCMHASQAGHRPCPLKPLAIAEHTLNMVSIGRLKTSQKLAQCANITAIDMKTGRFLW